jgi:hypothetical protein
MNIDMGYKVDEGETMNIVPSYDYVQSEDNTSTVPQDTQDFSTPYEPNEDVIKPTLKYMLDNGKTLNELKVEKPDIYASMIDSDSKTPDDQFIHMLSKANQEHYKDDPKMAEQALTMQLEKLGYDMEELSSRTSMYNRFRTGTAKSLTEAYTGITGAEEGDISYAMEESLGTEAEANKKLYESMNFVRGVEPTGEGFFSTEPMFKQSGTTEATEMATTIGEEAPTVVASMVGGVGAGAIAQGIGKGGRVATAVGDAMGDVAYTGARAMSEQSDIGATDVLVSGLAGVLGYKLTPKSYATIDNVLKKSDSLDDLPPKYRKAMQTLQKQTGKTDSEMIDIMRQYGEANTGVTSYDDLIRGASQSTNSDQVGQAIEAANRSPEAKTALLEELTNRSKQIEDTLVDNDELLKLFKKNTLTDKGRQATNWDKLHKDMINAGVDPSEPIMQPIAKNAEMYNNYDKVIHKSLTPKNQTQGTPFLEKVIGVKERASAGGFHATKTRAIGDLILTYARKIMPDTKEVKLQKIIEKSLKRGSIEPTALADDLIAGGVETNKARKIAKKAQQLEARAKAQAERSAKDAVEQKTIDDAVEQATIPKEEPITKPVPDVGQNEPIITPKEDVIPKQEPRVRSAKETTRRAELAKYRSEVVDSLKESNPNIAKALSEYKSEGKQRWQTFMKSRDYIDPSDIKAYEDAYKASKDSLPEYKRGNPVHPDTTGMSDVEILVSEGLTPKARATRQEVHDEFGEDLLKEAIEWQKGKGKGLRDYPPIRAKIRANKKK